MVAPSVGKRRILGEFMLYCHDYEEMSGRLETACRPRTRCWHPLYLDIIPRDICWYICNARTPSQFQPSYIWPSYTCEVVVLNVKKDIKNLLSFEQLLKHPRYPQDLLFLHSPPDYLKCHRQALVLLRVVNTSNIPIQFALYRR